MSSTQSPARTTVQSGGKSAHPKGLYLVFFTGISERFSYYGMRAILILFITKALFVDKAFASNIYGSFTGLVYLTPLLGGYISDRFWGNRRSILVGGLLMAAGQFLMFMSGSLVTDVVQSNSAVTMMWAGLTLLVMGNGFFKPCLSSMVGDLYPKGDHRLDSAYTIFYMGINIGAFFAPLICGFLGDTGNIHDFRWGFLASSIAMLVSIIAFQLFKNKYVVNPAGEQIGKVKAKMDMNTLGIILGSAALLYFFLTFKNIFHSDIDLTGYLIYAAIIVMPIVVYSDKSLVSDEKQRISVIFILAFFTIFFWACFEQAGASLTLFADAQTNRSILGWTMPASWFQSVNPLGIVILAPLFSMFWSFLNKRNLEPSSPMKMAFGLVFLALGYVVIAYGVHGINPQTKISMWFLVALYILHTMGELSLSPIGLSMVSKLAPARFASLLMGTWFLANAVANKLAGTLSALIPPGAGEKPSNAATPFPSFLGFEINNLFSFFCVFIALSSITALILFSIYKWLEKRMHGVK